MGWLPIVCAAIAAVLFYVSGYSWLFWSSVVSGVVATWSYGIMHNYAMEAARRRPGFSGRFYDISEREADAAPNWLAALNMLSSLAAFVLLIAAIFIHITN